MDFPPLPSAAAVDFPSLPSQPMNVPPRSQPPLSWDNVAKASPHPPNPPRKLASDVARAVGSCKSSKGVAIAVVDANAVIQGGERLANSADRFVSVPEVMAEIRDPVSRHKLSFLPFTIDPVEPSPESIKKVVSFARATGDLQTLSDVDLKLISLTYTLEAQIHGTEHLRDIPPPIRVNVKRLPEKDMPGWGSNVPNLKEWEALEHRDEDTENSSSKILPLKDVSLNIVPTEEHHGPGDGFAGGGSEGKSEDQEGDGIKHKRYSSKKKEINIEGKKMVASGVDASQGEHDDDSSEWLPAVSRSTHRRFLRRKARREALSEKDGKQDVGMERNILKDSGFEEQKVRASSEESVVNGNSEEGEIQDGQNGDGELSSIIKEMRLEENSLSAALEDPSITCGDEEVSNSETIDSISDGSGYRADGRIEAEIANEDLDQVETVAHNSESVDNSYVDDNSSEKNWILRSLSDSSVACVTSDFAMQNVILQIGLRLLAPEGKQIRQLHRWILKCHACYTVTAEIGRIFCPKCGNGGTLRKLSVTVGENGIVQSACRSRITLRGTKFSLPLPQGGRDALTKNPVLREDQLPHKVLYPRRKKKVNKQGEDIFTSDDVFFNRATKNAPLKPPVGKAVSLFYGRRNPNDNHYTRATARR